MFYICGGSNSLRKDGWVAGFAEATGIEMQNISVGAAPSQLGAFRCLYTIDLKPGDTVLWEYGVNDANHIDARGYAEEDLVAAVEWILRHCETVGAKFGALLLQPRNRERQPETSRYRAMLQALFDRYRVPCFDIRSEYVARHRFRKRIPPLFYEDNAHYKPGTEVMEMIVAGAVDLVDRACVPSGGAEAAGGPALRVYDRFEGGTAEPFRNRIIELTTWRPGGTGLSGTFGGTGRLVGMVITSTPKGGVLDVTLGDLEVRLSASYREKKFGRTMVKFISVPALVGRDILIHPGMVFGFRWAEDTDGMLADLRFKKRVLPAALAAREGGVVALMTIEDPA